MTKYLGFGTYRLSGNENKDIDTLKFAVSKGYNIIDTAESYGNGYSEMIVGKSISYLSITDERLRKKVTIISKVSPSNLSYENTIRSAKESVERLGTYIDCYLIHAPDKNIPISETFRAMEYLKKKKMIRQFGVSNFSSDELLKIKRSGIEIAAVEDEFSLCYQYNAKQLRFCKDNMIPFFAYMPLSNRWLLSGKNKDNLAEFCKKYNKTEAQIALKWVLQCGAIPIVGTNDKKHIGEDSDLDWKIELKDMISLKNKKWIPL